MQAPIDHVPTRFDGVHAMVKLPPEAVKMEFARRLNRRMVEKGWNQSELARRATERSKDADVSRDLISKYCRGLAIPTPGNLSAIAMALGMKPGDLVPEQMSRTAAAPSLDMRDAGDGMVFLRVNRTLPYDKALKILQILKDEEEDR